MRLFTIGYEKRNIDDFIRILRENNVNMLVDIRAVPHSRNKNYTRENLEKISLKSGIEYLSMKDLGSPEEIRNRVKADGDYDHFFRKYDEFLGDKEDRLEELANIAGKKSICLLCYEADVDRCHRRSVANQMAKKNVGFEIVHL